MKPEILSNTLNLKKGDLYKKKGFWLEEVVKMKYPEELVDYNPVELYNVGKIKKKKDGYEYVEKKKFWWSPEVFVQKMVDVEHDINEFEKGIKIAKINEKEEDMEYMKKKLKSLKKLREQMKKFAEYNKKLINEV